MNLDDLYFVTPQLDALATVDTRVAAAWRARNRAAVELANLAISRWYPPEGSTDDLAILIAAKARAEESPVFRSHAIDLARRAVLRWSDISPRDQYAREWFDEKERELRELLETSPTPAHERPAHIAEPER